MKTTKGKPPQQPKPLAQRALESRVRELENELYLISSDNETGREGWQRVYRLLYPQAIDGPRLGMPIGGSIETILTGIRALRAKARIQDGKNVD